MYKPAKYLLLLIFLFSMGLCGWNVRVANIPPDDSKFIKGQPFHNITLEMSLKPFKKKDKAYIEGVAAEVFTQWASLLRHTDTISVMLWTADGSEILEYKGLDQPLEWAKYIGNPNTEHAVGSGPEELSLHERAYLYMDNPPDFTYQDLKLIVQTLKETGQRLTGKPVRIGATFDPGPEFAKSDFKYKKHPEILMGNTMGHKTFVSSYAVLNADDEAYAGFPEGIPQDTPFGTFFGRQSQHFLADLGYDYLWLSNGFGFGMETWAATGAIFTGQGFEEEKIFDTREKIINFWELFRKECPDYRVETRGTNLATGIDLAGDGVDLREIYRGGYNILPPPNSPWAALNGDFGLELAGYMSRIAELPDYRYLFRYYTHDPWWVNSPWLDRYGREPHDIYLPMSIARINQQGEVKLPTHLNFLTIDNSFGEMPSQVPDEVIPHILKARYDSPTAPGPVVWVYPFDEYHDWAYQQQDRLEEIYYGDWFIRQAINNGLPLNTVISTASFQSVLNQNPEYFNTSILVSIVPGPGSDLEKAFINFVRRGGKLLVYGPADDAGDAFKALLNLENKKPLAGEFQFTSTLNVDQLQEGFPEKISHEALFSGGGVSTVLQNPGDAATHLFVSMQQGEQKRDVVWVREDPAWQGGKVAYVRGTNSSSFHGGHLLRPDDPTEWFTGPMLMRYVLKEFGLEYAVEKQNPSIKNPVLSVARSNNGFFFSGYVPNTTVKQQFKFPQGAPILIGYETILKNGSSTYTLPRAWHRECRVFIEQDEGMVSSNELHSGQKGIERRIQVTGLQNATVRLYPENNVTEQDLRVYLNASYPWKTGQISFKQGDKAYGKHFVVENVSGELVFAW